MSSDTFRYRVQKVEGHDVVLELRPTTAGGLCELAWSRAFVLMILRECGAPVTFEQTMDTQWLAEHLAEYVTRVVPERLVGYTHEPTLRSVATDWCIPAQHLQPRLTVRATLASEALAAHFCVGASAGTTAFDVWRSDPDHVALEVNAERPPTFDAQPGLAQKIEAALGARLSGWQSTPLFGLHRVGADARLLVRIAEWPDLPRSAVLIDVQLDVPAFEALPAPNRARSGRTFLVSAKLHDNRAAPCYWFRHFAGLSSPTLEYFDDDAPQEPFDAFVDRIACALEQPDLDMLLARDGLRGLIEHGLQTLPRKKGRAPVTPIGPWTAPSMPATWRWVWKHGHRWRPEPIWNRVALHAALGTRDEARAALAQAREISKQVPAVLAPLITSLDANMANGDVRMTDDAS